MSNHNNNRNDDNNNNNNYSPRPPFILNPYGSGPIYSQQNIYYPSTVNNGIPTYISEPMNYYPTIQQPFYTPTQPSLQAFNDEVIPTEPDEFILDLLKKPQERLFLLKLELEFEAFIKDKQRFRLDFPSMNSYQRLMIHKLAPYYKLNHFHDAMRKGVYVCKTFITELPAVRLLDISNGNSEPEKEQTSQGPAPQFKIMRRTTGSGSVSPRSPLSAGEEQAKNMIDRKNMTLEERKTAYEEARARIFQDLEEKQQQQQVTKQPN